MGAAARGFDARPIAAAVIAILTLAPGGADVGISPWCLTCGDRGLADLLLNVLLFAPLGAAIAARGGSPRRALLIGLAFSLGIELLQLVIPGRAPTARDIIANGFGCWLGARSLHLLRHWASDRAGSTRRLVLVTALLCACVAGLRWLDTPSQLRSYHWTQWQPLLGDAPRWPGLLLDVRLGGIRLDEGRLAPTHPMRDLLDADSTLHLALVAAGTTDEWMPILGLVDSWRVHLVLLGQDGDDLLLRLGRRAQYFLLESREIRFAGILRDLPAGSAFSLDLRGIARGEPCLTLGWSEQRVVRCAARAGLGSSWRLFLGAAPQASERRTHPLDALTLGLFLLPIGLLAQAMPAARARLAAALAVAALLGCATWLGYAPPGVLESLGAAAGLGGGAWSGRRLARRSGNVADDARPEQLGDGQR